MNIRKFKTGILPRHHLVGQVSSGLSTVATLALKYHDFVRGNFYVAAPEAIKIDQLSEFRSELFDADRSAAIQLHGKTIRDFISDPRASVVLQDFWHRLSDPVWEQLENKNRAIAYDGEIYWALQGSEIPDREIEELISGASYWPFCAFFYISSSSEPKKVLTNEDLQNLVQNLVGIAVDAFDANSFVIWWRDDLRPFPIRISDTN